MDWNIILHVTLPMLAGFGCIIHKMNELKDDIRHLDSRISRIEGYMQGRDSVEKFKNTGTGK